MKGFSRRVQHSIMGGIKSGLRRHPETLMIDRFFPSTQLCPECGSLNKHGLKEREYKCSCGYFCDRDTHSARNILNEGLRKLGREPIKMSDEKKSSVIESFIFDNKKVFVDSGSQRALAVGSSQKEDQPAHRQADRRMQKARHTDRSRHLLCGRARRGRCLGEHGAFNEPCRKQNPCRLFVNGNEL